MSLTDAKSARNVRVKRSRWEVAVAMTPYQRESSSCYSHVLLVSRSGPKRDLGVCGRSERASRDSCFHGNNQGVPAALGNNEEFPWGEQPRCTVRKKFTWGRISKGKASPRGTGGHARVISAPLREQKRCTGAEKVLLRKQKRSPWGNKQGVPVR